VQQASTALQSLLSSCSASLISFQTCLSKHSKTNLKLRKSLGKKTDKYAKFIDKIRVKESSFFFKTIQFVRLKSKKFLISNLFKVISRLVSFMVETK
jgi:hypothetical protein